MEISDQPPLARDVLGAGLVIPAHPLALTASRKLDERHQRALSRYYLESGAGGMAVGVHTTQFEIHDPSCGLLEPVLSLAAEEMDQADRGRSLPLARVAGICGPTKQAVQEAELACGMGYQFGLVSLAGMPNLSIQDLVDHCRSVTEVIDIIGFYLQPSVGGRDLPYQFWRLLCELPGVAAIKVAAFDRYRTSEVVRAVVESGREDIALYTGNDDNIIGDLLANYEFPVNNHLVSRRFVGGLLGQWAVWTSKAVALLERCHDAIAYTNGVPTDLLTTATALTDANSVIFDSANGFRGCVPGIHEVLRRQGLLAGTWCLSENEILSNGQSEEIDRVLRSYPQLQDDAFVAENLHRWLSD